MFLESYNHLGIEPLNRIFFRLGQLKIGPFNIGPFNIGPFNIGPIEIMWYAVLILTGAMIALYLGIREGKKIGIQREFLEDLVLFGLPIAVVGARIYYVVFAWDEYAGHPLDALKVWQGGLAIHGAIIFAVIWGYFFCKSRGVNFLKAVDLGAVGFLFAQAMGRWGNFMNQEAHGGVVAGNWDQQRAFLEHTGIPQFIVNQMFIVNDMSAGTNYYYPTFFYESIWDILGVIFLLLLRRTKYLFIGDLGLIYLIWYSLGRGIIEGLRTDSLYLWHTNIRMAQLDGIILIILSGVVLILRHYKKWVPTYYYKVLEENK